MRRCPCDSPKEAREVALMTETWTQTDLDQRQIAFGQQRFRALNTKLDQVLMRCRAGGPLEFAREVKTTHARDLGQLGELDLAIVMLADELGYLTQSSG